MKNKEKEAIKRMRRTASMAGQQRKRNRYTGKRRGDGGLKPKDVKEKEKEIIREKNEKKNGDDREEEEKED